jgi:hypothetical protein
MTLDTIATLRALLVPGEYRPAAAYDQHGEDTDSTLIRCGAMDVATAPEDHAAAIIALHNAAPEVLALAERAALVDAVREVWDLPKAHATWNAYLGREFDPEGRQRKGGDNDPALIAEDNARQWRVVSAGVTEGHHERLGSVPETLGEGATEQAAWTAALEAGRKARGGSDG